jgi:hypothetical protein
MIYTPDSPLLGTPQATPAQCIDFILARPTGEYNRTDITEVIVPAYFELCQPVGLDPVLLIAQMLHETGNLTSWWAARPRRNPAGIGVTGRNVPDQPKSGVWALRDDIWHEGIAFPSWKDDSIPAHIGRMLAYALTDTAANTPQRALITQALTYRPLNRYRGEAPTLRGLNGRWAVPGTRYADKLAEFANAMRGQV